LHVFAERGELISAIIEKTMPSKSKKNKSKLLGIDIPFTRDFNLNSPMERLFELGDLTTAEVILQYLSTQIYDHHSRVL